MNNLGQNHKVWDMPRKKYEPTGRLATPKMLEHLKLKLEKKGIKVSQLKPA